MSLTTDRSHPDLPRGVDDKPVEQAAVYCVLDAKEVAKGYIRPFRKSYWHLTCCKATTMADAIAATYASDPWFYSGAYCANCRMHRAHAEFVWEPIPGGGIGYGGPPEVWINQHSLDPNLWPDALFHEVAAAKQRRKEAREAAGKPGVPEQYWKAVEPPPRAPYPNHARMATSGKAVLVSWSDGETTEITVPPRELR